MPTTKTKVERVTVNLAPRSAEALDNATALLGGTKTETINKALQLFDLVMNAQADGGGVWIQDDAKSKPVKARFY